MVKQPIVLQHFSIKIFPPSPCNDILSLKNGLLLTGAGNLVKLSPTWYGSGQSFLLYCWLKLVTTYLSWTIGISWLTQSSLCLDPEIRLLFKPPEWVWSLLLVRLVVVRHTLSFWLICPHHLFVFKPFLNQIEWANSIPMSLLKEIPYLLFFTVLLLVYFV
jgi:hypothetical protein